LAYIPLSNALRPKIWDEFVFNEPIIEVLKHMLLSGNIPNGLLLSGTRGVGKTTAARLFAKGLLCKSKTRNKPCGICTFCQNENNPDIIEVDGGSHGNVDAIRRLLHLAALKPLYGSKKIFIIDEAHKLGRSQASWDALLKILEEPYDHIFWIFCTTQKHKVPDVIQSRLVALDLRRVPTHILSVYLHSVITKQIGAEIPIEIAMEIAVASNNSIRDGLTLLEKIIPYCSKNGWSVDSVRNLLGIVGGTDREIFFIETLLAKDTKSLWVFIDEWIKLGVDPDEIFQFILRSLNSALDVLVGINSSNTELASYVQSFEPGRLIWIIDKVLKHEDKFYSSNNKEMMLKLITSEVCL